MVEVNLSVRGVGVAGGGMCGGLVELVCACPLVLLPFSLCSSFSDPPPLFFPSPIRLMIKLNFVPKLDDRPCEALTAGFDRLTTELTSSVKSTRTDL